jgi:hypothetical protein
MRSRSRSRAISPSATDPHRETRTGAFRCRPASAPVVSTVVVLTLLLSHGREGPAGPSSLEPCSVFSAEEASRVLQGPVKQDVPSPIKYKGISTGGTCLYRSLKDANRSITIRTDATPTGAQRRRFEAGLRKARGGELSGIGDRAYFESQVLRGSEALTFLRGDTLTTVTVAGLDAEAAQQVAALVAPRLPTSVIEPPPAEAAPKGSGALDPALVGSWFLTHPSGRALANLRIERDGRFVLTLLAGNRQQQGSIDGEHGVLHLYPERGGHVQEIKYRVVDKNQMEWTDQQGTVTIVRRQFR